MHILIAAESTPEGHKTIPEFLRKFKYRRNGSEFYPFTREIRLYNVIIDESYKDEFLDDMKRYHKDEMISGRKLGSVFSSFLSKFLPIDFIDMSSRKASDSHWFDWKNTDHHGPLYLIVVGSLPDAKAPSGEDMK